MVTECRTTAERGLAWHDFRNTSLTLRSSSLQRRREAAQWRRVPGIWFRPARQELLGGRRVGVGEDEAMTEQSTSGIAISPEALAGLGGGKIAYVKAIRSEDVHALFPQVPALAPGMKLFALHAADGTPIMITDSREAAVANAWSNELEAVSVH
jgi:hypothetical protein